MAEFGQEQYASRNVFCTRHLGEALHCMLAVELRYILKEVHVCRC